MGIEERVEGRRREERAKEERASGESRGQGGEYREEERVEGGGKRRGQKRREGSGKKTQPEHHGKKVYSE